MSGLRSRSVPDWFTPLVEAAERADGQSPFSDQSLVELSRGDRVLVAVDDVAVAVVGTDDAELVVRPDARRRGHGTKLASMVLASGVVRFAWAHGDHPASRALAKRFGFTAVRTLLQLRGAVPGSAGDSGGGPDGLDTPPSAALDRRGTAALDRRGTPTEPDRRDGTAGLELLAFRPGEDDAAWLDLNARAFSQHPEQGRLTQRDLDARRAEPWFDPDDFLLLRDGSTLVAFCWLKVDGPIGEFYAVGVDPDRQGEGIGGLLMRAGFERLAARGIEEANLYVEADNAAAIHLYERFGFRRHTIDVRYAQD